MERNCLRQEHRECVTLKTPEEPYELNEVAQCKFHKRSNIFSEMVFVQEREKSSGESDFFIVLKRTAIATLNFLGIRMES